jgi:hypothetical protein
MAINERNTRTILLETPLSKDSLYKRETVPDNSMTLLETLLSKSLNGEKVPNNWAKLTIYGETILGFNPQIS